MATIKEAYCSFEVAKLLKEKGFHEKVNHVYHYYTTAPFYQRHLHDFNGEDYNNLKYEHYSSPTQAMAMKWLREEHNIHIDICSVWDVTHWLYQVFVTTPKTARNSYVDKILYSSYEQAVEAALKYVLENLI